MRGEKGYKQLQANKKSPNEKYHGKFEGDVGVVCVYGFSD